jgi:hypothetical protein
MQLYMSTQDYMPTHIVFEYSREAKNIWINHVYRVSWS